MEITFLRHSTFYVEMAHCALLFDWFEGELPLPEGKPLYVFASHSHEDHFSPALFERTRGRDVTFVLADEIRRTHPELAGERAYWMQPDETLRLPHLTVRTLDSTDVGVAFVVFCEARTLYHAGDLNWWDWGEYDTPEVRASMETRFKREIAKLAQTPPDVAFLPLDRRLGENAAKGLTWTLSQVPMRAVYPMHMWKRYAAVGRYLALPEAAPYRDRIRVITQDGQRFTEP